ncbi:MAG TPA: hypothetical protein EYG94_04890 [Campylobacterales bacterium]|nr:hypothetical protein [Campylobacterales bacterium]
MKYFFKLILAGFFVLLATSCTNMIAPHTAIKCKLNYDSCMIANTFEGPVNSHRICLAERLPVCHQLPAVKLDN